MKKQIFPLISTAIFVGIVILSFRNLDNYWAFDISIVCFPVYCTVLFFYIGITNEKESFKNPFNISINDNKRIVRVSVVYNDKLGLVSYGYKNLGIGDLQSFNEYYHISDIPLELREVDKIFKIESTEEGFVFRKIVTKELLNKTSKLEVSSEIYKV